MDVAGGLSLVQTILQLLDSAVWKETHSVLGVKSQLHKLKKTMSTIDAILREEERLHHSRSNCIKRDKLERLKEALYRADDLFDEVTTLAHRKKLMPGNNLSKEVSLFFSPSNPLRSAFIWHREIKSIREELDDVVKDHQLAYVFRPSVVFEDSRVMRETHSYVNLEDDVIIGRDDDKRVLIDTLLDTTVEENVSVVSIVGIGGLGKTTLAQLVYNDDKIKREFPLKMWVCVSDNFNVKALVGQILAAATNQQANQTDGFTMDQLQIKLRERIDRNKYLLVLDDVWNENSEEWKKLKTLLVKGGRGSRILVTTRSKEVVKVVGSSEKLTHELKDLSNEACWKLFERMTHPVETQLIDIGEQIVKKCAKVPLVIKVVGSLLSGQGESRWKYLLTDLAHVTQDEINGIVPVLKMSYYDLPFHLKSCFSYCAVFPKDYKIIKEDLICLWMAQGFIMPSDGESFEDAGDKYFQQLLQRCFFQDIELAEGTTNEIVSCKMHDLIHDLAKEVAGTDILWCTYSTRCFNEKTRHVHIDGSTPKDVVGELSNMQRMRTFLCTKVRDFSLKPFVGDLSNIKYLRVLCLNDFIGLDKLPSEIGELVHLRYLDLSNNRRVCVLPSSITKLYNLQTLKLCDCKNLKGLPRELGKLVNLRHLDIDGCESLTHMPPGMNSMTSLQKLTRFVVGGSATSNEDDGCSSLTHMPPVMNSMTSLQKLARFVVGGSATSNEDDGVGQLEDLDDFTNYTRTMDIIVKKDVRYNAVGGGMLLKSPKLWEIKYKWETKENNNAEELLQGLQPHSNLRKLELLEYPGVRVPNWISRCLPNLVEIVIRGCNRVEHLSLMSQLRHLEILELHALSEVEFVESSSNIISGDDGKLVFFPSLEESDRIRQAPVLYVSKCPNLTTLFSGSNLKSCLPNLVEIKICQCRRLEHLPMMSQLRHLKVLELEELDGVEYMESSSINSGDEDELVFFPSLEKLKLKKMAKLKGWWKPSSSESGESDRIPQAPLLSELYVSDCPNLTTLFVGSSINSKSCLPNLAKIEIRDCQRLEHLPMMSKLRHLKVLELEDLGGLEYMESSSNNISGANDDELFMFPSLEKVKLKLLPKLKGWWKSSSVSESEESETPQAPKLSHLYIRGCPELTTFPLCPGLQQLTLYDFNEALGPLMRETTQQKEEERHGRLGEVEINNLAYLNSLPIRSFHHISNLHIYQDQKIEELKTGEVGKVFRSGRLSSLRSLKITSCNNLKSISGRGVWDRFTALESLSLHFLHKLELEDEDDVINNKSTEEGSDAEMPWRYLAPTLRSLKLEDLRKVVKLPKGIGCLSSLHSLTLWGLPKVVKLPKGIGCLSSLHSLDILGCDNLESLAPSIGGLSSLHSLKIEGCDNLESLTPSIGGLSSLQSLEIRYCPKLKTMPKEMRHLTSLTKLCIWKCSRELMNECKNNTGANWSNIEHIPNIIQTEDDY